MAHIKLKPEALDAPPARLAVATVAVSWPLGAVAKVKVTALVVARKPAWVFCCEIVEIVVVIVMPDELTTSTITVSDDLTEPLTSVTGQIVVYWVVVTSFVIVGTEENSEVVV